VALSSFSEMLCSSLSYILINSRPISYLKTYRPAACLAFEAARIVLQKIVGIHYSVTLQIETVRSFEVSKQTCYPTRYKIFEDHLYADFPKIHEPPDKF